MTIRPVDRHAALIQRAGRPALLALVAAMSIALAACGSAPTRIYTLRGIPPAGSSVVNYAGPPVRVDAVTVPPSLDRISIVQAVGSDQLAIRDLDHWAAPLGDLARQALTADLVARLPPGQVVFPHLSKPNGALSLSVDVLRFDAGGGGAALDAAWTLNAGAKPVRPGGMATLHVGMPTTDSAAMAQGLSQLLAQLADRIIAVSLAGAPTSP